MVNTISVTAVTGMPRSGAADRVGAERIDLPAERACGWRTSR